MPFGVQSGVPDVITHAKFSVNRLWGFSASAPRKLPFPILFRTTLTTVLHYRADCDLETWKMTRTDQWIQRPPDLAARQACHKETVLPQAADLLRGLMAIVMQQRRQRVVLSRPIGEHASLNVATAGGELSQITALSYVRRNGSTGTVVFLMLLTTHGICGIRWTFCFTRRTQIRTSPQTSLLCCSTTR